MTASPDPVAAYGLAKRWELRCRSVLVEGATDEATFRLAARLERERTGIDLLGQDLTFIAAGERERGGATGVVRELSALRCMAQASLLPTGEQKYRFVGLFDNDYAGRRAIKWARSLDAGIIEYRDVFRLQPSMPRPRSGHRDPESLKKMFKNANGHCKGLDWELEDLLPVDFVAAFTEENPYAVKETKTRGGVTHRSFSSDGKAKLHYFIKEYAILEDLEKVVETIRAMRFYLGLRAQP